MTLNLRGWAALAVLAALAACGGGGRGSDDAPAGVQVPQGTRSGTATASSNITEANYASFAGPLARAVLVAGDADVPGLSSARDRPQARRERLAAQSQRWVRLTLGALPSSREQAMATTTLPARCLSGSIRVTLNDADNDRKLSAGDSLAVVAAGCVAEFGQPASTGSLGLTINAIELDNNDDPTALDVTITFSGFEEEGLGTLSGAVRLWFKDAASGGQRLRVSYSATAVSEPGTGLAYDFDITGATVGNGTSGGTFDMNGNFVIDGAGYAMTSTTFAFSAGSHPTTGSVTLRDFLGSTITLRARGDSFDIEFRPFGAPLPLIIPGFLWSAQRLGPG
jgi:hypothetical protein